MTAARGWTICWIAAASGVIAGCAAQTEKVDWTIAGPAFSAGQRQSPTAYDEQAAARCVGRWMVHHDALDTFVISISAVHQFPNDLRQVRSRSSAEFFRLDPIDEQAYAEAAQQAEEQLARGMAGSKRTLRRYFKALGRCSSVAEAVVDEG